LCDRLSLGDGRVKENIPWRYFALSCMSLSLHAVSAGSLKSRNAQAWLKVLLFIVLLNLDWHSGEKGVM